ncbi:YoaK family protein [Nakamurella leprariae]|uniref:DUF1275 domain-containing protein n=1 Tax=Nakamurella leprariae TaxID=2803911 RepID=A0A938YH19_9ACTN|nr:YoaK family protein [Nakamurella leprariae]MBM9469371.1 DUF1275 domain-containing protein [Nakamurella leprariae]
MPASGPDRTTRVLRQHVSALLLLTAATGVIDAVSYLSLDQVFTGNMTGNVLFIGFALVGVDDIPFLNNLVALLGFAAGAIVAARFVGRGHPLTVPTRSLLTIGANTAVSIVVAAVWLVMGTLGTPVMVVLTALLATAMGAQVAAVRPIGNADITTVVVTSTLANLSRDSRLAGAPAGSGHRWVQRLGAIVAMGTGALVGAAIVRAGSGAVALTVGAGLMLVAIAVLWISARENHRSAVAD